jgi:hypothetical protein
MKAYFIIYFTIITLLTPHYAHAYLVPLLGGAGAIITLIVVFFSFLAGIFYVLWGHIKSFCSCFKKKEHKKEDKKEAENLNETSTTENNENS